MLQFEASYFEGEEKEGFYVKPMMKRVWAAQLEVLQIVDEICTRHNIQYYADWGTLLGAIRHRGFIPWDDDVDICMPRMDYERFLKIAASELPAYCKIKNAYTETIWKEPITRVVNSHDVPYVPMREDIRQYYHGCPYCVGLDIFPLDYIPTNEEELNSWVELYLAVYGMSRAMRKGLRINEETVQELKQIENLCNIKFSTDTRIEQQLLILADKIAAMYFDTNADAKECTTMYCLVNNKRHRIPLSAFASAIRVPFENITIPIPVGYEKILTVYYGEDYMTPVQNAADHEYPFYKEQQPYLIDYYEKNNLPVPEYLTED